MGLHAPGLKDYALGVRAAHHLLLSHGWSVPVIHRNSPGAEVGITLNASWPAAASNSALDREAVRQGDGLWARCQTALTLSNPAICRLSRSRPILLA